MLLYRMQYQGIIVLYKIDETVEYPADTTVNIWINPQKNGIHVDILNPALYNAASVNPTLESINTRRLTNNGAADERNEFASDDINDRD